MMYLRPMRASGLQEKVFIVGRVPLPGEKLRVS